MLLLLLLLLVVLLVEELAVSEEVVFEEEISMLSGLSEVLSVVAESVLAGVVVGEEVRIEAGEVVGSGFPNKSVEGIAAWARRRCCASKSSNCCLF